MGWKNFKEHFGIKHIVHVENGCICIGSHYVNDLIVVGMDGQLIKTRETSNDDLNRYQQAIKKDPQKVRQLIAAPDVFERALPVYACVDGEIVEKQCEEHGFPNVTHDGELMYENSFSEDRLKVVRWAKAQAQSNLRVLDRSVEEAEKKLAELRLWRGQQQHALDKLNMDYPHIRLDEDL